MTTRNGFLPLLALLLFALPAPAQTGAGKLAEVASHASRPYSPSEDWFGLVSEKIRREEYHFSALGHQLWSAPNRSQGLRSRVGADGIEVFPRDTNAGDASADWSLHLRTASFGRIGASSPLECSTMRVDGNRIELDHGRLIEWFINREEGVEQGWTLAARPAGAGPVTIGLAIDGGFSLRLDDGGRSGVFMDGNGTMRARYSGLAAWDATGLELPVWMSTDLLAVSVHVDDTGATYPVTVDPLLTNEAWSGQPNQAGANYGTSVASAGDVNGDGFDDVIIGSRLFDNGEKNEGRAFVYLGSALGLAVTADWTAESNQVSAAFGSSVASAGDVNNDGFDDVIVGAHWYDNGEMDEGRAYVYHGSSGGLALTPAWTAESNQAGTSYEANFGDPVSSAGDVNGDGYDDVIVGARSYDNGQNDEGRAFVYHGSATGLTTNAVWTAEPNVPNAYFGASLATAGDVNADGYSDVIIGAYRLTNGELAEGRVYVYHGSPAGLSLAAEWSAESDSVQAFFGVSVATAGDVNGDGYSDVIIGASGWSTSSAVPGVGRAFVYHGSAEGLSSASVWFVESLQPYASLGASVSTAGDVDGDGYADVIIGAPDLDYLNPREGRVYVHHGSPAGLEAVSTWAAGPGPGQAVARFGASVSTAGDVNGDGFHDIVIGSPNTDRAVVYHGSPAGIGPVSAAAISRNAGLNPTSYVSDPPVLGGLWGAAVHLNTTGHTHAQVLGFTAGGIATTLAGGQTLLVTGALVFRLPLQAGPVATWTAPIPSDESLCGVVVYTQAIHVLGVAPYALSNAQDLLIGY